MIKPFLDQTVTEENITIKTHAEIQTILQNPDHSEPRPHFEENTGPTMEQNDNASIQATLDDLKQELASLRADNIELARRTAPKEEVDLHEDIMQFITPHLQVKPVETSVRKRVLAQYPKCAGLPKALNDNNGLAAKAVGGYAQPDGPV